MYFRKNNYKKGNYSAWYWCQLGHGGHQGLPKGLYPVKQLRIHIFPVLIMWDMKLFAAGNLAQKCCPMAWRGCSANTAVCIALPLLRVTTTPSAPVFSRAHSIALFTSAYETPEQIPRSLPLTRCVPLDRLPTTSSSVNQMCMWTVSGGWKCLVLRKWVTALRECYEF